LAVNGPLPLRAVPATARGAGQLARRHTRDVARVIWRPFATPGETLPAPRRIPLRLASMLALLPASAVIVTSFFVFVGWTVTISFTSSKLLPTYHFVGFEQYRRLFSSSRWWTSMENLAIYAALLIGGCMCLGMLLAVLIERCTRMQRLYRTLIMLPLAMSFVTTGLIWQWLLNPSIGIEHAVRAAGWSGFQFDWLVQPDRAIYTIALAGIWQQTGMCMALMLAGLRGIDPNYWKVARIDGISTWRTYLYVILPQLRASMFTGFILLFAVAAKSYDLVVTLTGGGPGFSSDLPARFVIDQLARNELGVGAAGACMLLLTVAATVGPYVFLEIRRQQRA
jgi:glucose/mannose transport system permease protein